MLSVERVFNFEIRLILRLRDVTATLKEIDYTDVDYFNECGEWRMYCGNAIRAFIWDYDQSKNLKIKVKGNVIATGDGIIAEYGNFVIEGDVVSEFENGINVLVFRFSLTLLAMWKEMCGRARFPSCPMLKIKSL